MALDNEQMLILKSLEFRASHEFTHRWKNLPSAGRGVAPEEEGRVSAQDCWIDGFEVRVSRHSGDHGTCRVGVASSSVLPPFLLHLLLLSSASSFTLSLPHLLVSPTLPPVSCKNGQQPDYKTRMQHDTLLLTGSTEQNRARASARRVTRGRKERARRGRDSDEEDDRVRGRAKGGCGCEISSQTRYESLLCFVR